MNLLKTEDNIIDNVYSDEELLLMASEKPAFFALLVRKYEEAFVRKAMSIVNDKKEAEDIVQDAFLKIYIHSEKFRPVEGATFKSWAYRILINTSFTHYQKLKKKRNIQIDLDPEMYEVLVDDRDEVGRREVNNLAWNLLSKLPEQLSRPLRLFFIEEYSQKEIADMEGTSVAAIKTRIYRGKNALQEVALKQGDIV